MKTALAIAAHPDDIEFLMAGTLLALQEVGYSIHYLNLANGCCGTTQYARKEIIEIRRAEAQAAAASLGAVFHDSLCNDLEIFYCHELLTRVASIVRDVEPDILLTHAPSDYMEDHMNTSRLAVTAAFARGMPNYPVQPPRAPTEQAVTVYHAQPYTHHDPLGNLVHPELYVDVADWIERKVAALSLHVSQKKWLDESQGHDSYLETLRRLDRQLGQMSKHFEFAEGWRRHLPIGFCGADADPLSEALGDRVYRSSR